MPFACIQAKNGRSTLYIKVKCKIPLAKIGPIIGNYLRMGVKSAPEKGKANKEIIKRLSKQLGLSQAEVSIVKGQSKPEKTLLIHLDADTLHKRLSDILE